MRTFWPTLIDWEFINVSAAERQALAMMDHPNIAKALSGAGEEAFEASLARTQAGEIIGTPQYMSPEQAGSVPDVHHLPRLLPDRLLMLHHTTFSSAA